MFDAPSSIVGFIKKKKMTEREARVIPNDCQFYAKTNPKCSSLLETNFVFFQVPHQIIQPYQRYNHQVNLLYSTVETLLWSKFRRDDEPNPSPINFVIGTTYREVRCK